MMMQRSNLSNSDSSINTTHASAVALDAAAGSVTTTTSHLVGKRSTDLLLLSSDERDKSNRATTRNAQTSMSSSFDDQVLESSSNKNGKQVSDEGKNHQLEDLKSLIRNLEMLEKTNTLESLLSPRISTNRRVIRPPPSIMSDNIKISDGDKNELVVCESNQNHRENSRVKSSGKDSNPLRVIKITEIIEIDDLNTAGKNTTTTTTTTRSSTVDVIESNNNKASNRSSSPSSQAIAHHQVFTSTNLTTSTSGPVNRKDSEFRQLPILIEMPDKVKTENEQQPTSPTVVNKNVKHASDSQRAQNEGTKSSEIVFEIINIVDPEKLAKIEQKLLNDDGSKLDDTFIVGPAHIDPNAKPKKITIRITGRTRSTSSDAVKNQLGGGSSLTACIREPILVEDVSNRGDAKLDMSIKSVSSKARSFTPVLNTNNKMSLISEENSFKPIGSSENDDSAIGASSSSNKIYSLTSPIRTATAGSSSGSNSNNEEASRNESYLRRKESDIKSDLNEIKFNLEKFKSYLTTLSESTTGAVKDKPDSGNGNSNVHTIVSRSNSMPPKIKPTTRNNSITTQQQSSQQTKLINVKPSQNYDLYNFNSINNYDPSLYSVLSHSIQKGSLSNGKPQHGGGNLMKASDELTRKKRTAFRSAKNRPNVYYDSNSDNNTTEAEASGTNDEQPIWTYRENPSLFNRHYNELLMKGVEPSQRLQRQQLFNNFSINDSYDSFQQPDNHSSLFTCGLFNKSNKNKEDMRGIRRKFINNNNNANNQSSNFGKNMVPGASPSVHSSFLYNNRPKNDSVDYYAQSAQQLSTPSRSNLKGSKLGQHQSMNSPAHMNQSNRLSNKISSYYNDFYSNQPHMSYLVNYPPGEMSSKSNSGSDTGAIGPRGTGGTGAQQVIEEYDEDDEEVDDEEIDYYNDEKNMVDLNGAQYEDDEELDLGDDEDVDDLDDDEDDDDEEIITDTNEPTEESDENYSKHKQPPVKPSSQTKKGYKLSRFFPIGKKSSQTDQKPKSFGHSVDSQSSSKFINELNQAAQARTPKLIRRVIFADECK